MTNFISVIGKIFIKFQSYLFVLSNFKEAVRMLGKV